MAHNGGRYQTQNNFPDISGTWPFCNLLKMQDKGWEYASGRLEAGRMNAQGHPTTVAGGSLKLVVNEPGGTYRSGNRILAWDGTQTFTVTGASVVSGSLTGSNGRAVMELADNTSPRNITITLTATDGNLTHLRWLHEDDETRYNAEKLASPDKEPFSDNFLSIMTAAKPGVLRFLDWQYGNFSNVFSWAHRTPVDFYNYAHTHFPPSLYAGDLTGGPTTFTATLSGFALTNGATVIVDIPSAISASGTTTLNVSSTGAIAMKELVIGSGLVAWTRSSGGTPKRGTFTYLADLAAFVTFGTETFNEGLKGGVPPSVMIDLCNELNCHGHFVPPCLTCDAPSDYVEELAYLAANRLNAGLQFRIEMGPNETWNNSFPAYYIGAAYSTFHYSVVNRDDWYGRVGSLNGNTVKTKFGGDRSRYAVLCGVQTGVAPDNVSGANTMRRMESTRHVLAGGTPATNFITHVCPANYWTTMHMFADTQGTTAERYLRFLEVIRHARSWNDGDAAAKLAAINWVFEEAAIDDWVSAAMVERLDRWSAVAQNYNIFGTSEKLGLTFYEGNYYPGDITANAIHGIDGVTRSATGEDPTVILVNNVGGASGHAFVAGMTCTFRNLGGITQLNGIAPVTVLSVTDTTITLDLDSSGFSAFTSGGSGTWAYNGTSTAGIIYSGYGGQITAPGILHAFLYASRFSEGSFYATQEVFNLIMTYPNAEFPSDFNIGAGVGQWQKYDDFYSTPSPQVDAMKLFNRRLRRKRLTATP